MAKIAGSAALLTQKNSNYVSVRSPIFTMAGGEKAIKKSVGASSGR